MKVVLVIALNVLAAMDVDKMPELVEERVDSLDEVFSQIMDVELQMTFLAKKLSTLTKVLRSRPLKRKSLVCGWCHHSESDYNVQLSNPEFDLRCEFCGKEGCVSCTDWYVENGIKHFLHKFCKSKKFEKEEEERVAQKKKENREETLKQKRKEQYEKLKKEFET